MVAALGRRACGPEPHFGFTLGHLDPIVLGHILDLEAELFSHGPERNHCPTGIYNDRLLVLKGHILAVEAKLQRSFAVVVQVHAILRGGHLIVVLGGPGLEGHGFHHSREVDVSRFLGEQGTHSGVRVHEELATIDVDAGVFDSQAIDENFRRSCGGLGAWKCRDIRLIRGGRAIPVDVQGGLALRPTIAEIAGPIGHDELGAGGEEHALGLLGENLEHVALGLDADVVVAVDIGSDARHPDVVHIHSGRADIQVDISGVGGGAHQSEHHDDSHQAGHKPCFFHCTFLRFKMCVGWVQGCAGLAIYVNA